MKKCVFLLVLILFCVPVFYFSTYVIANEDYHATVVNWENDVEIKHADEAKWIIPEKGMILLEGDSVKTGDNALIVLDLGKDKTLRIQEKTAVTLQELKQEVKEAKFLLAFKRPIRAQTTVLDLAKGEVLSKVSRLNSKSTFNVKTPRAIAGVRGTGFSVKDDGVKTSVMCWSGKVILSDLQKKQRVFLKAGKQSSIAKGEAPKKPFLIPSSKLRTLSRDFKSLSETSPSKIPEGKNQTVLSKKSREIVQREIRVSDTKKIYEQEEIAGRFLENDTKDRADERRQTYTNDEVPEDKTLKDSNRGDIPKPGDRIKNDLPDSGGSGNVIIKRDFPDMDPNPGDRIIERDKDDLKDRLIFK